MGTQFNAVERVRDPKLGPIWAPVEAIRSFEVDMHAGVAESILRTMGIPDPDPWGGMMEAEEFLRRLTAALPELRRGEDVAMVRRTLFLQRLAEAALAREAAVSWS